MGVILNAFKDEESMVKSGVSEYGMRSYFEKDRDDENLYLFHILNSKDRNRIVPIDETIWSFHHKPPHDLGVKVEFETKGGKKDFRYETNIIDVCICGLIFIIYSNPQIIFRNQINHIVPTII